MSRLAPLGILGCACASEGFPQTAFPARLLERFCSAPDNGPERPAP